MHLASGREEEGEAHPANMARKVIHLVRLNAAESCAASCAPEAWCQGHLCLCLLGWLLWEIRNTN